MTEHSIEEPDADVAEQSQEVFPDADEPEDPIDELPPERPLEADEADALVWGGRGRESHRPGAGRRLLLQQPVQT